MHHKDGTTSQIAQMQVAAGSDACLTTATCKHSSQASELHIALSEPLSHRSQTAWMKVVAGGDARLAAAVYSHSRQSTVASELHPCSNSHTQVNLQN